MKRPMRMNPKNWFAVLLLLVLCVLTVQASAYIEGEKYRYYCTGCRTELAGTGRCPHCGSTGKKEIPNVTRKGKWSGSYVKKTANGYDVGAAFKTEQAGDLLFDPDKGMYYLRFTATLLYKNKKVKSYTVKAYETGAVTASGAYVFKAKVKFSLPAGCRKGDYTIRIHAFVPSVHGGPYYEQAKRKIKVPGT